MLFPEEDVGLVKQWLITELEPICDADPDVLADYVLALFKYDTNEQELLTMMNEQLADFLEGGTEPFVNKAYHTLNSGGYRTDTALQSRKREAESDAMDGVDDVDEESTEQSFKRQAYSYEDTEGMDERAAEAMPENPEGMPFVSAAHSGARPKNAAPKGRCRDYHNLGMCSRGATCKFYHSDDSIVGPMPDGTMPPMPMPMPMPDGMPMPFPPGMMPPPEQMAFAMEQMQRAMASGEVPGEFPMFPMGPMPGRGGMRGMRARGRGRGARAGFTGHGAHAARSKDTLVIENIPQEHLALASVNDYFKKFGTITNIEIDEPGAKATVSYATPSEADAAHKNPDVIFGNRFVKVYFQRLDGPPPKPSKPNYMTDKGSNVYLAPSLRDAPVPEDQEKLKAAELRKKKQALLTMQLAEQKSLVEKLSHKELTPQGRKSIMVMLETLSAEIKTATEMLKKDLAVASNASEAPPVETDTSSAEAMTNELQAKLASLRKEAASLGLERGRGRGTLRGRGRGFHPRGMPFNRSMTLDNRTTRVGIAGLATDYDQAKVQAHLQRFGPVQSMTHEDGELIVQYRSRASGEMAMRSGATIPEVGDVQLRWVETPQAESTPATLEQAQFDADARENWKR
ncbi:hypothetical protein MVES_000233 [Malassezia vespertilionis]|uniref:C3H1-type domain-containing protein n=1 Tax=Malassezia vespertilionis TaxID=2020962 RepID=A0A2N1JFS2_9BASI|nr:hypothetical protein MVES_000233 [Malassezia vespertilionis]